jgi:hypothetical protein
MRRTLRCHSPPGSARGPRSEGRARAKPIRNTKARRQALVERGSEEAKDAGSRKYTDRSAEMKLSRPPAAIRSKARREDISLKPTTVRPITAASDRRLGATNALAETGCPYFGQGGFCARPPPHPPLGLSRERGRMCFTTCGPVRALKNTHSFSNDSEMAVDSF